MSIYICWTLFPIVPVLIPTLSRSKKFTRQFEYLLDNILLYSMWLEISKANRVATYKPLNRFVFHNICIITGSRFSFFALSLPFSFLIESHDFCVPLFIHTRGHRDCQKRRESQAGKNRTHGRTVNSFVNWNLRGSAAPYSALLIIGSMAEAWIIQLPRWTRQPRGPFLPRFTSFSL